MATDVLSAVGRTNLALGIAILIVLVLRAPARRLFGARLAYPLWILPVLTAFATLLPGPRPSSPIAISAAFATSLTPHLNRTPYSNHCYRSSEHDRRRLVPAPACAVDCWNRPQPRPPRSAPAAFSLDARRHSTRERL
jgi:hypothetical protein